VSSVHELVSQSVFATRLSQAIKSYEAGWKSVDDELYEVCRRRPSHRDFADVYTKVAMIGRVYRAGLARTWRGEGNAETEITHVLMAHAGVIESGLRKLEDRAFDRQAADEIVELHGRIARAISRENEDKFLTSFVSKYLHFHCPLVPIYDSRAHGAIKQYVDRRRVRRISRAMFGLPEWSLTYRRFVAAFVVLYELAQAETDSAPSAKELDYLLWQVPS
jgi:hypothetical protein